MPFAENMPFVTMAQNPGASLVGRLRSQLASWPAMIAGPADCGIGAGFAVLPERGRSRQIVHLHGGDEADLLLTWPVVARLGRALLDSGRVEVGPGWDWVRVRLETGSDVALVVSLISVAIQTSLRSAAPEHGGHTTPCRAAAPYALVGAGTPGCVRRSGHTRW